MPYGQVTYNGRWLLMLAEKDFLNPSETARLLNVHVETVRRLARSGGIPAFKVGRGWRIMIKSLLKRAGSEHYQDQRPSAPGVNDHLTNETKK